MAPERSVLSYSLISYNHMFILDILGLWKRYQGIL